MERKLSKYRQEALSLRQQGKSFKHLKLSARTVKRVHTLYQLIKCATHAANYGCKTQGSFTTLATAHIVDSIDSTEEGYKLIPWEVQINNALMEEVNHA